MTKRWRNCHGTRNRYRKHFKTLRCMKRGNCGCNEESLSGSSSQSSPPLAPLIRLGWKRCRGEWKVVAAPEHEGFVAVCRKHIMSLVWRREERQRDGLPSSLPLLRKADGRQRREKAGLRRARARAQTRASLCWSCCLQGAPHKLRLLSVGGCN